jgi:hypothetical protein
MADIDVVKKGSTTWLWIVLVLAAVALVLWFALARNHAPQTGFNIDQGVQPMVTVGALIT